MKKLMFGTATLSVALGLFTSAPARAEERLTVKAKVAFGQEPPVAQVVEEALKYFRVHPEALDGLRTRAKTRALLPMLAAGYRFDDQNNVNASARNGDLPVNVFQGNLTERGRLNSLSVGAVWDLREAVFNPAEVQVYGLIGVQRDVMLEVTRTYYLRKQLVLRRVYQAPEDEMALAALDMRIDEFTAILDMLTGGWFSRQRAQEGR